MKWLTKFVSVMSVIDMTIQFVTLVKYALNPRLNHKSCTSQ